MDWSNYAYALKAVKLAGGDETPRFEAKLTLNGKVMAHVSNGGHGGSCDWHWLHWSDEAIFKQWIAAHTTETFEPEDGWVYDQLSKVEEAKLLMRRSLKATVFKLDGDPDGEFRTLNQPDSPKAREWLKVKYGAKNFVVFDRKRKEFVRCAS